MCWESRIEAKEISGIGDGVNVSMMSMKRVAWVRSNLGGRDGVYKDFYQDSIPGPEGMRCFPASDMVADLAIRQLSNTLCWYDEELFLTNPLGALFRAETESGAYLHHPVFSRGAIQLKDAT